MLTATGTVTKVEEKPWKGDPSKSTVYVYVSEHGYSERYELSHTLDKSLAERLVGKLIAGAVRVFRNYDEASKRLNVRVVLMSVEPQAIAA